MNIPTGCSMVEIKADKITAWDAEIRNGSDLQELSLPMLLVGDGEGPEINHLYKWFGTPVASSRGSKTLFICRKFESAKQDLDNFEPDPAMAKIAHSWVLGFEGEPEDQIEAISKRFEQHVTQIFGQPLLHMAIDLVYHSVLKFSLNDKLIARGWMEALAVGETRSGKSTTAQRLQDAFGYGQIRSGENTTVAGLLSGVEKRAGLTKDGSWAMTVGELPLCDRRLLVIDEAQGLEQSDIGKMSDVRSRGIVDIRKIRSGTVNARVRIIWLANSRKGDRYKYGIHALSDQMGAPEDLARVDLPLFIKHDIGDDLQQTREHFSALPEDEIDIVRWIVLWAWSRRAEDVVWTSGAVEAIFDLSDDLATEFSTSKVPVLPQNEAHIRLARVAVAVAARLFSSPDGIELTIRSKHVKAAYELYKRFLSEPTLGIIDIKEEEVAVDKASSENVEKLRDILESSNPEVLQKVAVGGFDRLIYGAQFENAAIVTELSGIRAIVMDGSDWTVTNWAQDVAKDIERERRQ